jgi:maltose-binding protein MalE
MRNKRMVAFGVLAVAVVAVVVLVGKPTFEVRGVEADDSTHTTSLSLTTHTFDPDIGAEDAVVASISSTDQLDARWAVTIYITLQGQSEQIVAAAETLAADGWTGVTAVVQRANMPSGAGIRAHFQAWDSGGSSTFSYSRTATIP